MHKYPRERNYNKKQVQNKAHAYSGTLDQKAHRAQKPHM